MEGCSNIKIRAASYPRVSTDEQTQNQSIKNQIRIFEDFYSRNNSYINCGFYKDDGVSGTIAFDKRPGGARLLSDARAGKFDLVLVTSTDRLGRSLKVMLDAVDTLSENGVGFKSITEPYQTETPEGKMMFGILANFSE